MISSETENKDDRLELQQVSKSKVGLCSSVRGSLDPVHTPQQFFHLALRITRAIPGWCWSGNQHFTLAWRTASIQQTRGCAREWERTNRPQQPFNPIQLLPLPLPLPLPPQPYHTLHTGHRYFHTSDSPRCHVVWSLQFVLFYIIVIVCRTVPECTFSVTTRCFEVLSGPVTAIWDKRASICVSRARTFLSSQSVQST